MSKKRKKIAVFLTSGLLSFISASCSSKSDAEQKALAHLERKYGMPFEVISTRSVSMVHRHDIRVRPLNNPSLTPNVTVTDSGHITDFYVESKYEQEATAYVKEVIDALELSFPFSVRAKPSSNTSHLNFKQLPAWKTEFFQKPQAHKLLIRINFFSEPNDEALSAILKLDKMFRAMKLKKIGFTVGFFDKASLNGQPVDSFYYGYSVNDEHFEGQKQHYFKGRLLYYIDATKEKSPTKQQLRDNMRLEFVSSFLFTVL